MVIEIPLKHGQRTIIDDEDAEKVAPYSWCATWHQNTRTWRVVARVTGRHTLLHRLIMDAPAGVQVDHINGDPLDNRRSNLRLCNNQQNHANMGKRSNTTSQYKGVCWFKPARKWSARIKVNYKSISLGYFDNEIDAARAYNEAATQYFGEFARLNEI